MQGTDQAIAFFLPHLGGGGAEMNAVRVANAMAERGCRVSLVTVRPGGPYEPQVSTKVNLVSLGSSAKVSSTTTAMFRAVPALRRWLAANRPDILVPVMDLPSVAALLAAGFGSRRPRIVLNIQNNPDAKARQGWVIRGVIAAARLLYPRADSVVALSKGVGETLSRRIPELQGRIHIIPNIGYSPDFAQRAAEPVEEQLPSGRRLLVAVGRLVEQKGYPVLLDAMARLKGRIDCELWILGTGPLEGELKSLSSRLGLEDRVRFLGFRKNPYAYMARADLFVLSSLWEGFGNVIVEAMAAGAPVVVADCPYGPAEIVSDGRNGRLVPIRDPAALADAIEQVLGDASLRQLLRDGGSARARDYDSATVADRWLEALDIRMPARSQAG